MKYIDSEKLIAEIEKYKQGAAIARFDNAGENAEYFQGKVDVCDDLTHIIASLQQEQPDLPGIEDPGIPGKDFIPVEWVDACEMYGKWKIVKLDQPEVDLKTGIELIAAERKRQIEVEGWSKEHDAEHASESLALAAVCYAMPDVLRVYSYDPTTAQRIPEYWPWDRNSWKPSPENRIKELVKAGALIAAEIDKLNARKEQPEGGCSEEPNNLLSKM